MCTHHVTYSILHKYLVVSMHSILINITYNMYTAEQSCQQETYPLGRRNVISLTNFDYGMCD